MFEKFRKPAAMRFREVLAKQIRVRQPKSWQELSDQEAWLIFSLHATDIDKEELPLRVFMALNRITVMGQNSRDKWLCTMPGGTLFELDGELAAELAAPLRFMLQPSRRPWRPERFRGFYAISPELYELTFADWLVISSTLQGVIATGDFSMLDPLNVTLMRRPSKARRFIRLMGLAPEFTPAERLAVFFWLISYRDTMARRYPELFKPAGSDDDGDPSPVTPDAMRELTDTQLRALTGGDVTKEAAVMELPIDRAFAELNAKAREYREIKSKN